MRIRWKWVLGTAAALLALGAGGFFAFLYSGFYPIAANRPHTVAVGWILTTLQENAVGFYADEDIPVPDLDDPALQARGTAVYHEHCMVCHGAPGVERAIMGRGLNPDPPRLVTEIREWSDPELYWIVANGLKMAGMPAFQPGLSDRDVWASIAFMRALRHLSPQDYRLAVASVDTVIRNLLEERRSAPPPPDFEADPGRGRLLVEAYGCGSCHQIPGIANSKGHVGPPLTDFGRRHYIAGALINNRPNLARFILAPESVEPGTAMPSVHASPEDALHMAAYLLTLGGDSPLEAPSIFPAGWLPH